MTNTVEMVNIYNSQSMEETNNMLEMAGLPTYDNAITIAFRDRKKVFFIVNFGSLKCHTQQPYFSTSANELNFKRTDYVCCGQAQDYLLKNTKLVAFYDKWNKFHLKNLNMEQYNELVKDVNELKNHIPFITSTNFSDIVSFDRQFK